jgi:hypothetical protein
MKQATTGRTALFVSLAAAILATRGCHVGALPDASWAAFFVGGFYFSSARVFALLMTEAAAIDYVATHHFGVSTYCISPAYVFLLPAHGALWFGGRWLRKHYRGLDARSFGLLAASLFVAVSSCYLVSNGSFYWFSGRYGEPTMSGWIANFGLWYLDFLSATLVYAGIAAVLHVLIVSLTSADAEAAKPLASR